MTQGIAYDLQSVMVVAVDSGLGVSLCTIQQPANTAGEPTVDAQGTPPGTYTAVSGLSGLVCQNAPESWGAGIRADEAKAGPQTTSMEWRHVLLYGYYPTLTETQNWGDIGWRAVITDPGQSASTYDLLGAESDSQCVMTRLKLRRVTV